MPLFLTNAKNILAELLKVSGKSAPPELTGVEIGEWIRRERIKILGNVLKGIGNSD
ncbi:MAG: hypothetical protein IJT73_07295 [Selenomonadaceae bacterium]|nr:hypothetical protein [Selenomonadaceae bacterium]